MRDDPAAKLKVLGVLQGLSIQMFKWKGAADNLDNRIKVLNSLDVAIRFGRLFQASRKLRSITTVASVWPKQG
jgi:hypothetical protein